MTRSIKLMWDYGCSPLWHYREEVVGDIALDTLPLSTATKKRLVAWAAFPDAKLDRNYPPDTVWTDEESTSHEAEGRALWRILQNELGPGFRVAYFCKIEGKVLEAEEDAAGSKIIPSPRINEPTPQSRRTRDISWLLLLAISAVVVGSIGLLQYNVLYTEGEVMQGLFTLLVFLTLGSVLIGFYRRIVAVWVIVLLGGSVLLWQSYQTRKWVMIHEDIVSLVRFAEDSKTDTGRYPANLEGYTFKRQWVKSHIYSFGPNEADEFGITYFMNDPGTSYWYSSKTGFGYYPD